MSAPPPDLAAYHVGIVVREVDASMERYRRLVGVYPWKVRELRRARPPWRDDFADTRLKIAYGRGAGMTWELIQVLEGTNQHSEYLRTHGEGVQHVGFWTPDLRASVTAALAAGAQLVNGLMDESGAAALQITPRSPLPEVVSALDARGISYVDPGFGSLQLEFVGSSAGLRAWMGDDFDRIVVGPAWERT